MATHLERTGDTHFGTISLRQSVEGAEQVYPLDGLTLEIVAIWPRHRETVPGAVTAVRAASGEVDFLIPHEHQAHSEGRVEFRLVTVGVPRQTLAEWVVERV